jgi:23S rRNA (pseudouridine1915-N3)-methyltransferase
MKILIAMPTKSLREASITEALAYLPKLRPPLSATALFTSPKTLFSEQQKLERMNAEGLELLQKTSGYYRIALSNLGPQRSSEQLSSYLEKLSATETKVAFIIGGAFGLSLHVIQNSNAQLSLSAMTLPHRLAFLVLAEQLYRSSEIMRNSAYHK